jgi:hypothetical protein
MADKTGDLYAWGELALETQRCLAVIPDIGDDELRLGLAVSELDEACASYFGCTEVVLYGSELLILNEQAEPIFEGRGQAVGVFIGAKTWWDGEVLRVGYYASTSNVDTVQLRHAPLVEDAAFVIAPVATSDIWAPDDVFKGCANIQLPNQDPQMSPEAERIDDLEHRLDEAVLNGRLDIENLVAMFTEPGTIHSDLETHYFIRRLNNIVRPNTAIFSGRAWYKYVRKETEEKYSIVTNSGSNDEAPSFTFANGAFFQAMATKAGGRMLCLVAPTHDTRGLVQSYTAVDVSSIEEIKAYYPAN